jgi:hypothetical protein|tara:strand:- start:1108 stop:1362 length:255 start_codon:yes stop_codon:yes gene_type:complete
MKYVLVDNNDNINTSVDLQWDVGISGARTYFLGTKKIKLEEFDKLWKVMTKDEYDRAFNLGHRKNKQYEWWKEDKAITDEELKF